MFRGGRRRLRRTAAARGPAALAALGLAVTFVHLVAIDRLLPDRIGAGADATASIARLEVAFVRELAPAAPPPVGVMRPSPRLRRAVAPVPAMPPADPPRDGAAPDPRDETPAEALPAVLPELAALPEPAASAPDIPVAAGTPSPAAGFEWPPSTRLSYRLAGWYRGAVEGQARVEWLASGSRYQVHLDVSVGPWFAPLVARTMSSEGRIGPDGLEPQRYVEETRIALREPRRVAIEIGPDGVRLPGGRRLERPPGLQDSASQFVHMTWLFTVQPERLEPGRSIEFPLALPRRVDRWVYEVIGRERVATPAGEIEGVHVRPRRDVADESRRRAELTAEFWVAPTLQNLPVRIVIRQDDETWVDLTLERLPQQGERR